MAKEIDIQVHKAQRVPNKLDKKSTTPRHIIIKMPKAKDRENLKSSKRKAESYLQRSSHKNINWSFKRNFVGKKYSKS